MQWGRGGSRQAGRSRDIARAMGIALVFLPMAANGAAAAEPVPEQVTEPAAGPASNPAEDSYRCFEKVKSGEMDLAIVYCGQAIDSGALIGEDLVTALINRGVAYKQSGKLDLAIQDYTAAILMAPDDALLYANRANALREVGEYVRAMVDINKAVELKPDRAASYFVRGQLYEVLQDRDSALADYREAVRLAPDNQEFSEKLKAMGG